MNSLFALACLLFQQDPLEDLCARFSKFDPNQDGAVEIEKLTLLNAAGAEGRLVLVLVEARILEGLPLPTFAEDLRAEGWDARLVSASVYAGDRHQDGRTLLALRTFFQSVREKFPKFAGAVLVGSFPEAQLVRSYNWRKKGKISLREKKFDDVEFMVSIPELVAHRCELVLCDLDGRWEERYFEARQSLPTVIGIFPGGVPARGGICKDFERGTRIYEDFFYVNDGRFDLAEVLDEKNEVVGLSYVPLDDFENGECSEAEARSNNPMAKPDIFVTRINARGVALRPLGELLDDRGKPRRVKSPAKDLWEPDPVLERRLLVEYFDRNHRYRLGKYDGHSKVASIAHELGSGKGAVAKAVSGDGDHVGSPATLVDLVKWLSRPALLRDLRAHSDRWGSVFAKTDAAALESICGPPWSWSRKGEELVPTLPAAKADFYLYRTLWENGVLPDTASFYYHTGCESISPAHSEDRPYNQPQYGRMQGGEAILFYAKGLALVGRSKVFYDAPRGFYEALAEGKTFGEAWGRYFEIESSAKKVEEVGGGIGRKRSYWWSVLGDWTLKLRPAP